MGKIKTECVALIWHGVLEDIWTFPHTAKGLEEAQALRERLEKKYADEGDDVDVVGMESTMKEGD